MQTSAQSHETDLHGIGLGICDTDARKACQPSSARRSEIHSRTSSQILGITDGTSDVDSQDGFEQSPENLRQFSIDTVTKKSCKDQQQFGIIASARNLPHKDPSSPESQSEHGPTSLPNRLSQTTAANSRDDSWQAQNEDTTIATRSCDSDYSSFEAQKSVKRRRSSSRGQRIEDRSSFTTDCDISISKSRKLSPGAVTLESRDSRPQHNAHFVRGPHEEANSCITSSSTSCGTCRAIDRTTTLGIPEDTVSWIKCDACQAWIHLKCAGISDERDVAYIAKFRCSTCIPAFGSTTYVRRSSRAVAPIDYAELNQGIVQTSIDRNEHHYISLFKSNQVNVSPDQYARVRADLITADFFEKGNGLLEPIIVPAGFNAQAASSHDRANHDSDASSPSSVMLSGSSWHCEAETTKRQLGLVIPKQLTVRDVASLHNPFEKIEVIDVKTQNGDAKKWTMNQWVSYFEDSDTQKTIRNVISLEVSRSKLGRLIRRPQLVRDLDMQDSVWPDDLAAKCEQPYVQNYCLMSVADCFTDFHIDFGGSSVFYHILRGSKTFFFIPPKEKNLKKYEEWCTSPDQNWTFLPDQTQDCCRVDLYEGDTMLIPSGWIHAVWTPSDSLVIGGNFLTKLDYGSQIRVAHIEKTTGVARRFQYPHFHKMQWYAALEYLQNDPVPEDDLSTLLNGGTVQRDRPIYDCFGAPSSNNGRYCSIPEMAGFKHLTRFLVHAALLDLGFRFPSCLSESRNVIQKAIPRGHGSPLNIAKAMAVWSAWKRGNETIPEWAYPGLHPVDMLLIGV